MAYLTRYVTPAHVEMARKRAYDAAKSQQEIFFLMRQFSEEDEAAQRALEEQESSLAVQVRALQAENRELRVGLEELHRSTEQAFREVTKEAGTMFGECHERLDALERDLHRFCGVYTPGERYKPNSLVIKNGSLWFSTRDTDEVPGSAASGWQLATKVGSVK